MLTITHGMYMYYR